MHYVANVCVISQEVVYGEIVPSMGEGSGEVDKNRPVLSFRLGEDKRWHAWNVYNLETDRSTEPPPCFKPRSELTNALDEALRCREGQSIHSVEFFMDESPAVVRATGQAAKDLKESEAEAAIERAWDGE